MILIQLLSCQNCKKTPVSCHSSGVATPPLIWKAEALPDGHSTKRSRSRKPVKPEKPYPDFPLFAHNNQQWAKKFLGKLHYFGSWNDPQAALDDYLAKREDLKAGRTPREDRDGLTLRELCNRFLTAKQSLVDSGERSPRTFQDYYRTCEHLLKFWGKDRFVEDLRVEDFDELRADTAKRRKAVGIGNMVRLTRIVIRYAYEADLIDRPVKFGPTFKEPDKRTKRREKRAKGKRMYDAKQIRKILNSGHEQLVAMTYLGINCGLGNTDCSEITPKEIDLKKAWLDYPRVKTEIDRTCPLWPETVAALKPLMEDKAENDRIFTTVRGNAWVRINPKGATVDNVAREYAKLLKELGIYRAGVGFYALRHTFETIAGDTKDQVTTDRIMGHVDPSMAGTYREEIFDKRLQDVVNHVRSWLFSS